MKKPIGSKKLLFSVLLLGLVVLLFFSHKIILVEAGRFLAPEGMGKADVVILEGTELIRETPIRIGISFLSSGRANRMVVVYQESEKEQIFARPLDYNLYLTKKLEDLGLEKDQIKVLKAPKEHPITLTEARIVLSNLSKTGVRSAVLLSEGFHTRRSYWAYKQVGLPLGIEIIPYPYFMRYQKENWWQRARGSREFIDQCLKFFYYLIRGYIPVKSLLVT